MKKIFVTGTGTDVGKTIVSAGLCMAWPAHYWKPIQAGYRTPPSTAKKASTADFDTKKASTTNPQTANTHPTDKTSTTQHILPETDNETLSRFIPTKNIYPSAYSLKKPLSPNQAGQKENKLIKVKNIAMPKVAPSSNLVIEGAGGALVPINEKEDMTNLMKKTKAPVLIVSSSALGTLNHTFLTLFALRAKKIPILGVVMVGPFHPDNKRDIEKIGKVPVLLELPFIKKLTVKSLSPYFNFL